MTSQPTQTTDDSAGQVDHTGHDTQPYAERFPAASGKANSGIFVCNDCETTFSPDSTTNSPRPARVI